MRVMFFLDVLTEVKMAKIAPWLVRNSQFMLHTVLCIAHWWSVSQERRGNSWKMCTPVEQVIQKSSSMSNRSQIVCKSLQTCLCWLLSVYTALVVSKRARLWWVMVGFSLLLSHELKCNSLMFRAKVKLETCYFQPPWNSLFTDLTPFLGHIFSLVYPLCNRKVLYSCYYEEE